MINVVFVGADGVSHARTAEPGSTLMRVAVQTAVPGILAECGGACACATCHVYVDAAWADAAGAASALEAEMLEFAVGRQPTSRLSCQIELTQALDGLVAHLPTSQK